MTDREGHRHAKERRVRDRALIVPAIGAVLLLPPFVSIFHLDVKLAGIPVVLLYLFAVWAGLIACTALLSRSLKDRRDREHRP